MKANELRIGNHIEIDQYPNDRAIAQIEKEEVKQEILVL